MKINKIYNCDCLSGLKEIGNNTIDMVITSPPYDDLREYEGFVFTHYYFLEIVKELYRVLKKGGVVIWVVNDETYRYSESGTAFRQALEFKSLGFCIYDTMIFAKKNPRPFTHRRYEQEFEFMFVFSKGNVKTFTPVTVECKNKGKNRTGTYRNTKKGELKTLNSKGKVNSKKIKGNIWYYSVGNAETNNKEVHKHQAIFPEELVKDHILSWSNEEEIVLDIFMGSGTVAKVAFENNRKFMGFEISKEYCDLANRRLEYFNIVEEDL